MANWTFDDIPPQTGRIAIVSGANTGIGYETARMLAAKGAQVVLACRNAEKGAAAAQKINVTGPAKPVTVAPLDLADLESVAAFAAAFQADHDRLDLLVNNAGVMVPPLGRTAQGFELQFGTNHLGHFALTGRLLPLLERTPNARVVVVSSSMQKIGRIDFDDLNWEHRRYAAWQAYAQSKLANMSFALELARRLTTAGSEVRATAAHPGWTATDLARTAGGLGRFFTSRLAMTAQEGALTTLRAATDPAAEHGGYWGPGRLFGMNGPPVRVRVPPRAKDPEAARRLWAESERLTGVTFPFSPDSSGTGRAA
ncbi:putative short-chain dehydrogenase/reductase [Sphaerisporangium rufum]|uniref:Short-chain dehydrogenase/reductase n=1 Tax=Sphaerisporangium rufum TaxID=1381558 RepID=A0A919R409_9ACTN|nr:oxidoreductase [Sphaerisporangium rufum]GII76715.1 putative short-chain dehydrogenase/reductase [Sphaerisporangium rufum]